MPSVAILVLNWNGWRDTIECLESLYRLDYPNVRVIVCDNASTDDSVAKIRGWARGEVPLVVEAREELHALVSPPVPKPIQFVEFSRAEAETAGEGAGGGAAAAQCRLVFIHTGGNLGFAGGNNVGLRYVLAQHESGAPATPDYVWLLNNDMIVARDSLRLMVEAAARDKKVGCVGATLLEYSDPERVQSSGGGRLVRWQGLPRPTRATGTMRGTPESDPGKLDFLSGGCMLARTETLAAVGLIDERYFLYCEDIDYSLRVERAGFSLANCPAAEVWHKGGAAVGYRSPTHDYYMVRSALLLVQKFYPRWVPLALAYSVFRCGLPKLVRGQWRRLAVVIRAQRDFFRRATGPAAL